MDFHTARGIQANRKPDQTVVTEADLSADRLIRNAIQEHYPDDGILSEEACTEYPKNKTFVWVIDPLDGTTNFSLGLHYWGVSIARLRGGYPDLAVLYFPIIDELFWATKGGGAYLNGIHLQANQNAINHLEPFFSCCSRTNQYYRVDLQYKTRILGSAAYGLCTVVRGSAILAIEVKPKIWDFCGSWLITEEAGGYIAPLDRETIFPLVPGEDYGSKSYPLLVAGTKEKWEAGRCKITEKK